MEIYKLKANAWEEYCSTLSKDDMVGEDLHQFLLNNSGKQIKVIDSNEELAVEIGDLNDEKTFWVEGYQFEKIVEAVDQNSENLESFEDEEDEDFENEESFEEIDIKKVVLIYCLIAFVVGFLFSLIVGIFGYSYFQSKIETKEVLVEEVKLTESQRLNEELKSLVDDNLNELEFQKNLRIKKQEFITKTDQEINNSIQNVKNNKLRITEIETLLIEKAQ